jgi:hypothetical protein
MCTDSGRVLPLFSRAMAREKAHILMISLRGDEWRARFQRCDQGQGKAWGIRQDPGPRGAPDKPEDRETSRIGRMRCRDMTPFTEGHSHCSPQLEAENGTNTPKGCCPSSPTVLTFIGCIQRKGRFVDWLSLQGHQSGCRSRWMD